MKKKLKRFKAFLFFFEWLFVFLGSINANVKNIKIIIYEQGKTDQNVSNMEGLSLEGDKVATLTELNLSCGHRRNNMQMTFINNPLFSIFFK